MVLASCSTPISPKATHNSAPATSAANTNPSKSLTVHNPVRDGRVPRAPDQAREVCQEGEEERRLPVAGVGSDRLRLRNIGTNRVADDGSDLGRKPRPTLPGLLRDALARRRRNRINDPRRDVLNKARNGLPSRRVGENLYLRRIRGFRKRPGHI